VNFSDSATVTDVNGHGTHVGGIKAATNNGLGVAGLGYNTSVMNVKVMVTTGPGAPAR
jgi:subtilisin family serine protease